MEIRLETTLSPQLLAIISQYAETLPLAARQRVEKEFEVFPVHYLAEQGASMLTARRNDRIIGCVALRRDDDRSAMFKRLFVEPEQRGQGVARRLVEAATEAARKLGYRTIVATTFPDLAEAQAFYEALGFVRDDEPRREGVGQLLAYRLSFASATDTRPE